MVDTASGAVIAAAHNRVEAERDPTAHAEILAIRAAGDRLGSPRLAGCDLYVTLEPCPMCAQAIAFARLRRLYFAAYDPKGGGVEHGPRIFTQPTCHHRPEIYGGIGEGKRRPCCVRSSPAGAIRAPDCPNPGTSLTFAHILCTWGLSVLKPWPAHLA